jgi:hypothetical protein
LDRIREFEATDVEQVADLHRTVFGLHIASPLERYYSYFLEHFLARDAGALPSLVSETKDGRIMGFLGVVARHFSFKEKQITAALSSQFVVHPEGRRRLTAIHLLRAFLNGRQDLSFTDEANDASSKIWVALGGSISTLQGIHWIVPLRPVRIACDRFAPAWVARSLSGPVNLLDRLISCLPGGPFQDRSAGLTSEILSTETMLTCLNEIRPQCQLRPRYDYASLSDTIERAGKRSGSLRRVLLRDHESRIAGWYVYHCKPGGLAEVLQMVSREDCQIQVVAQMSYDAREHGAIAAVGRLEPGLAEPLANRFCFLFRRKYAMLVHSRSSEILSAIHSGQAFISRLEGEWCLRFA